MDVKVAPDGREGCTRWGAPFHRFSHRCPTCGGFSPTSHHKTRTFAEKSPTFFRKSPTFFRKSPTFFRKSPTFFGKSPTFLPRLRSDFPSFAATAQNKLLNSPMSNTPARSRESPKIGLPSANVLPFVSCLPSDRHILHLFFEFTLHALSP